MAAIIRCNQHDLPHLKPVLGKMYYCTDSRILYKDHGPAIQNRLRFNAIILQTDNQRVNDIKPTVGKFYYVIESNSLWLFDTRWVLKIGDNTAYNTYGIEYSQTYNGQYYTPVINTDTSISGIYGDKIIDNNGLLGDGSVVIRDTNRINRGQISADNVYQQLVVESKLDNGFLFIPNGHMPYKDLSTSFGALHLTVDKKLVDELNDYSEFQGCAHYYGTWHNYGNMYIIEKNKYPMVKANFTPSVNSQIFKYSINCYKYENEGSTKIIKTMMVIRPVTDTAAIVNIVSVYLSDASSVVKNDMDELLYTHSENLLDNGVFEATRSIYSENGYICSKYVLDDYENNNAYIIIKTNEFESKCEISPIWHEEGIDGYDIHLTSTLWNKNRLLTTADLDSTDTKNYIHRVIS